MNTEAKETLQRIAAKTAESTALAVETIERLTEACEEALEFFEKFIENQYIIIIPTAARISLRDKLREALGKP